MKAKRKVHMPMPIIGMGPVTRVSAPGYSSVMDVRSLGEAGKRFVGAVPHDLAHKPVRVFVGKSSATTDEKKVDLAMQELERSGAFRRNWLLVAIPTGAGHVNPVLLETVDRMAGGNSASVAIQYGGLPSAISVHKVRGAARLYGLLLKKIRARLNQLYPAGGGPKVVMYGESLGAWIGKDVLAAGGPGSVERLGIHRALWVGVPGLSHITDARLGVGVARTFNSFQKFLSDARRGTTLALGTGGKTTGVDSSETRIFSYSHRDDPVHRFDTRIIYKAPKNNDASQGASSLNLERSSSDRSSTPETREPWIPVMTFLKTTLDVIRSQNDARPGVFHSKGHDYRAEIPYLVREAFGMTSVSDSDVRRLLTILQSSDKWVLGRKW